MPQRSWRYYAPAYARLLTSFRNAPTLIRAHHAYGDTERATLWSGRSFTTPNERRGFVDTVVEVWGAHAYTAGFYTPRDGDTVLDIGANIGLFSAWLAHHAPRSRVLAFEPFPENVTALRANTEGMPAVEAFPVAIGGTRGRGAMSDGGARSIDHQLGVGDSLDVVTLPDVIEQAGGQIALLKMDIEGSEADAFREPVPATLLRRCERIAIEYHEHLRPGVRALIHERLAATHRIVSEDSEDPRYGLLRAVRT